MVAMAAPFAASHSSAVLTAAAAAAAMPASSTMAQTSSATSRQQNEQANATSRAAALHAFIATITVPDLDSLDSYQDLPFRAEGGGGVDMQGSMEIEGGEVTVDITSPSTQSDDAPSGYTEEGHSQELAPAVDRVHLSISQEQQGRAFSTSSSSEEDEEGCTAMDMGLRPEQYLYVVATLCQVPLLNCEWVFPIKYFITVWF